jgi:Leucine-rich repeat (LRR) protein
MATLGLSHNLFEHIPDVVFTFKKLRSLMLQHNLIGFIPERFAIFKRLTDLNLSFNMLISIPPLFKDLTDLRRLHIDRNELYQFPTVVTGLTNLTDLSLVGNMIPTIPEEACGLFLLKRLRLGGNRLLDLPQHLTNLRSLTDLGLQNNALSVFAPHIGRMTHLTVLRVLGNKITTPFPQIVDRGTKPFLSFLRRLEKALDTGILDLSKLKLTLYYHPSGVPKSILLTLKLNNNLLPTIDGSQFEGMVQLERLEIGDNLITEFPKEIGSFLTTITSLDVKNCQVSILPTEWQTLHQLTELDFSSCLIDQLPLEYGHLTSLQTLTWNGNYLKNPQPDILQQGVKFSIRFLMTILRCRDETPDLNLQRHKLLTIPKILGTLSSLNSLRLDHNRLFFLPDFIGRFTMLRYLSLSCNYFRELPKTTRALTNLEFLDLHLNYFSEIPEIASRCTGLVELNLSDNQVSIAPPYVAKLTRLTSLNLDNNCIMTLPTEWYVLTNLKILGLRNNLLRLPLKSLCDGIDPGVCLEFLACLHEAEKTNIIDFSGRPYKFFPGELCRLTNLTDLRLQHYQMSYLSYTISTLTKLLHVELDHNHMDTLPPAFSKLHLMQFFSMSYNKLFMPPVCMASLTSLQCLDLSHNMMTAFSDEIATLTMLRSLIINNNQIFRLPTNIGSCDALEILDAHSNRLTDVPASLVDLKHVTHLLLFDNYITELPLSFCLFQDSSLLEINVSDNGLMYPPARWWSRGLRASWSYMRRFYDALDPKQTTLDVTCLDLCVVPAQAFDVIQRKSSLYSRSSFIGIPSTALVVDPETDADLDASDVPPLARTSAGVASGALTQKSIRAPSFRDVPQTQTQTEAISAPPEIKEDDVPYIKQLVFPSPSACSAWGMGLPVPFVTMQAPFEKKEEKAQVEEKKGSREKTLPAPPVAAGRGKDAKAVSPLKKRKVEEEEVILARTRPERILLPTGGGLSWGAAGVDDLHLLERDERPIAASKLPAAPTPASKKKIAGNSPTKRPTADVTVPAAAPDLYRIKLAPYIDPCPVQNLLLGNNPRLSFLPVWTGQCTALTRLSLRYTACTVLPYYLGRLTTLTEIDFAGCDITRPDVIIQQRGTLAMLQYMRQIDNALWTQELDLSGQDFAYIPLEVRPFAALVCACASWC